MKSILFIAVACTFLMACGNHDTQIADSTFIHGHKVYKIIDNEIREIGDLNSDTIKKFAALKPKTRNFGMDSLDFVKAGAYTTVTALYRGNYLYYDLKLHGFNDLKTNYSANGKMTINFLDEYGFILHSTDISVSDFIDVINNNHETEYFSYSGKTEMSTDINAAISRYDVSVAIGH